MGRVRCACVAQVHSKVGPRTSQLATLCTAALRPAGRRHPAQLRPPACSVHPPPVGAHWLIDRTRESRTGGLAPARGGF
jgi:hypothetical protein